MKAGQGKILIVKLEEKPLALLVRDNQVLSAQVLASAKYTTGSIYLGKVQSVSQNIEAAFVDLGGGYLAFLPLSDAKYARPTNRSAGARLKPGDELPVQLVSGPVKTKQAKVTARLSLAGQFAVVGMQSGRKDGSVQVSSKLSKEKREHFKKSDVLRKIAGRLSLTVRTNAGTLADEAPLIAEAQALADTLGHIQEIAGTRTCYSCLHQGKPDYAAFVENAYRVEYDEVITDIPEVFNALQNICKRDGIPLRLYKDELLPLFKLYSVEMRMQELLAKKVWLKSGGYLVIEPTEALISIDVNTGKCETGKDSEETFFKIDMEAAEAIALHLRARNLSGMILVDFINLKSREKETALLEYMRSLLKKDPVRADALDMTALGLMELTRKRTGPSLAEQLKNDG